MTTHDLPTPYYDEAGITIYHGDCKALLPEIPDGSVDLVLTDPPYGISLPTNYRTRGRSCLAQCRDYPPVHGDKEPFDPTPFLRWPCILWGANYYADKLKPTSGWLVWDKLRPDGVDQADAELAWTSMVKGVRCFRHLWHGFLRASEHGTGFHPTQKPVALMRWCLAKAPDAKIILDPYMGAGPTLVAAKELQHKAIGIEIEERYCEIAARRLTQDVFDWKDEHGDVSTGTPDNATGA